MIEQDIFIAAHNLVSEWEGKEGYNVPSHIITEIFTTHNRIFPDKPEYSKGCGGCRERTWNRLKSWYHANKHLYGY